MQGFFFSKNTTYVGKIINCMSGFNRIFKIDKKIIWLTFEKSFLKGSPLKRLFDKSFLPNRNIKINNMTKVKKLLFNRWDGIIFLRC